MDKLPPAIREAAEQAANKSLIWAEDIRHFTQGVEWLYAHLTAGQAEFDEAAAEARLDERFHAMMDGNPERGKPFVEGARWQHAQSQAVIAALRAENAQRLSENDKYYRAQDEKVEAARVARDVWTKNDQINFGKLYLENERLRAQIAKTIECLEMNEDRDDVALEILRGGK